MKKNSVKWLMIILAIMFTIVSYTGCSSAPVSAPAPARTATGQYATITFRNETGTPIFYLYISERTNDSWGSDWLGENVLPNNDTYTTRLLTGQYDVRARNFNGDTYTFWITVNTGGGTFTIRPNDRD